MILAAAGLALSALAAFSVWCAADRIWHAIAIVVLAVLLFPLTAATRLTGDVSRHLPSATFAEGLEGKDQVIIASAAASFLFAILVSASIWGAAKIAWRSMRRTAK
jgi:hypothetical protein